jgi:catechol 2,3-dioxygenase-like lactoylglutathione lyase family enzyme
MEGKMIKAIHHTAISVSDLDASIHFYRDLLGMTLEWRMDHRQGDALERVVGMKNVDVSIALLSGWGSRIELLQYLSPKGKPYPPNKLQCDKGIIHLAFQVVNIDDRYKQLLGQGVQFNAPPLVLRPGVKATYFHDPDGMTLELVQYNELPHITT